MWWFVNINVLALNVILNKCHVKKIDFEQMSLDEMPPRANGN
jgi:hypothetical protein